MFKPELGVEGPPLVAPPNFRAGGTEGRPKPTDLWRTPPQFFARLNEEFHFALDAACTRENCLAPKGLYVEEFDALSEDWAIHSVGQPIWLNPPYSDVKPWLELASSCIAPVVCLITADPSTRWWRDYVATRAAEIRFVVGRIKFHTPDGEQHSTKRSGGGTTTPSAIAIYRPQRNVIHRVPVYSYMLAKETK